MNIKQLFITAVLFSASSIAFADCDEPGSVIDAPLLEEVKTYEGTQYLLDDEDHSDFPSDWLSE